ncbi:CoA-binding protein [Candidatus Woesearchaeota archaeon]|nr:CoA-binding protein [Candidatus Woesearchaeota archaeon]
MDFDVSLKHAVIGASKNSDKYGFKILQHLKQIGVDVIPVNPNEDFILDLPVIHSINDLDNSTVLAFVVPPSVTFEIVKNAVSLGFKKFWFQPGSFNDEILSFCDSSGVEFSAGVCLLHQ